MLEELILILAGSCKDFCGYCKDHSPNLWQVKPHLPFHFTRPTCFCRLAEVQTEKRKLLSLKVYTKPYFSSSLLFALPCKAFARRSQAFSLWIKAISALLRLHRVDFIILTTPTNILTGDSGYVTSRAR